VARFDPETGLLHFLVSMRYKGKDIADKTLRALAEDPNAKHRTGASPAARCSWSLSLATCGSDIS
jgi:hypothetical protein